MTAGKERVVLATQFHEAYERLAPSFGYETRPDTKAFDPTSANGKLMTAVCAEVAAPIVQALSDITDLLAATVTEFGCWTAEDHPKVVAARTLIAKARGEA